MIAPARTRMGRANSSKGVKALGEMTVIFEELRPEFASSNAGDVRRRRKNATDSESHTASKCEDGASAWQILLVDDAAPRSQWSIGRIISMYPDAHSTVRNVMVKTRDHELRRPIQKLCLNIPAQGQCDGES